LKIDTQEVKNRFIYAKHGKNPEPEIMGAEEEATVYNLADFSEINQAFANGF